MMKRFPNDPQQRFRTAEGVIAADWHDLTRRFYEEEDELDGHIQRKLEQLGIAWDRDAYVAMQMQADKLLHRAVDGNDRVAICAVAGIPWFANIHQAANSLLLAQLAGNDSIAYQATVALTLGLLPSTAHLEVKRALEQQVESSPLFLLRLSSAIALVFLYGSTITEIGLQPLLEAEDHRAELNAMSPIIPYKRPLMGFCARALHRLGF